MKRTSTENLGQLDLNTGLASPSVHRTLSRLALKKQMELMRGASAKWSNEDHCNNVADGTRQGHSDPSPTSPKTIHAHDKFALKRFQSRIAENPTSKKEAVPLTSKIASRPNISLTTAQSRDQDHHVPDKPLILYLMELIRVSYQWLILV